LFTPFPWYGAFCNTGFQRSTWGPSFTSAARSSSLLPQKAHFRATPILRWCYFPKVCPSRVGRLTVDIADFGVRPLAGHIKPSKATCRIRSTTNANLLITPPIPCAGYSANRSATAGAHLPPKFPSCRGITQNLAKSFGGQHGQSNKRTVDIGQTNQIADRRDCNNAWSATLFLTLMGLCPLLAQSGKAAEALRAKTCAKGSGSFAILAAILPLHWRVLNIVDGKSSPPNCSRKARAVAKSEKHHREYI
jgi:hypothetical protein